MEMPKSSKNPLLELAGESLLERLKEFKDNKKKSRDSCDQKLLDEVTSGELISVKSKESEDKNPGRELIRYHSVVDLDDDLGDDFSSCADSVDLKGPAGTGTLQQANQELSNFVQKKSIAQGMMDLALVSANTNQLRYVMDIGDKHPYYYTSIGLILTSLVMQLIVGLALLYNSRFNIRKRQEMQSADRINDFSVIGVFLITLINVFISTFNGSNSGPYAGEVIPMSSDVTSPLPPPPTTDVGSILNATFVGGS
ncbi:hypothetical protein quinque_002983 [Culex quinquefasciatus]